MHFILPNLSSKTTSGQLSHLIISITIEEWEKMKTRDPNYIFQLQLFLRSELKNILKEEKRAMLEEPYCYSNEEEITCSVRATAAKNDPEILDWVIYEHNSPKGRLLLMYFREDRDRTLVSLSKKVWL